MSRSGGGAMRPGAIGRIAWPARRSLAVAPAATCCSPSHSARRNRRARPSVPAAGSRAARRRPTATRGRSRTQIMDALGIADGSVVADIGAGGGWFTVRLARRVGPNGRGVRQDVQRQMLEAIRRRVDARGLRNVQTVLGDDTRSPPAAQALDAVLIVDVYHEVGEPRRAAAQIARRAEARRPHRHRRTTSRAAAARAADRRTRRRGAVGRRRRGRGPAAAVAQETFLPFQYFAGASGGRGRPRAGGRLTTAETRKPPEAAGISGRRDEQTSTRSATTKG